MVQKFLETVWAYYAAQGRDLPWRESNADGSFDSYKILVSEIMLQQTQVPRVVPKYQAFVERFPMAQALANAPLADVLVLWNGLGYNRRAKYLHDAAKVLAAKPQPWSPDDLTACKGIGPNTAAAVCVYAYNRPLVFIETNIRTVFIHHFFADRTDVSDKELVPIIDEMLDREHPREFYWALMDYGTRLKATAGNAARASKHYTKQSAFQGSRRQVRGQVLRLLKHDELALAELAQLVADERLADVISDLQKEGLVTLHHETLRLG